jgi:hypothetical protein
VALRLSRKQKQALEKDRVVADQWARYVRARDNGHTEYVQKARRCNDFYVGKQWAESDTHKLDREGRPWLTLNMVLSTVNAVVGEQTKRRVEFKYKPATGGNEGTATTLTKLSQLIKDANDYDYLESQVFQDGIIQDGRGFFDIRMDFSENIQGDIVMRSDDSLNIILDPDAKEYDPDTWSEVFETRWLSVEEIEQIYGRKKADEVRTLGINGSRHDPDSLAWESDPAFGDAREKVGAGTGTGDTLSDSEEKSVRSVRVLERQHVQYRQVHKFVDPQSGEMRTVPETWDDAKIQEFAEQFGLFVTRTLGKKIRWTATADKVLLHDDWSPYKTFTKIPYFAFFRRGKPFGLVSNLLSPQELLNKLSSQELHIINTTANSGWIVEEGALVGMTADDLRNNGAETGLVITTARGRKDGIEKITANSVPTGVDRLSQKAALYLKEISGVNEGMRGTPSPKFSGVALEKLDERGQVMLQIPFDNLDRTRRLVGRKILELIQQFYTEERVFHLTIDEMDFQQPNADQETLVINHMDVSGQIVNDVTVGKYDVSLAFYPARDSFDDSQLAEAVNLRSIGVMIPDDRLVEYSHLAKKHELANEIREMTGRGEPTEEELEQIRLMQMIQQQMAILEVQKASAEVAKLEAEASRAAAEADRIGGGVDSPEHQMRLNELQVQLQIARENLMLRRDLAQLAATSRLDAAALGTQGKVIVDTNKAKESRKTELLKAQGKLATDANVELAHRETELMKIRETPRNTR